MAFDEHLAIRIRDRLAGISGITEKKMFGGLAFMSNGHMFIGIIGNSLMARVGPADYEEALRAPHVRKMDFTGKPMRGYVFVEPPGYESHEALSRWISKCRKFVKGLPPKG